MVVSHDMLNGLARHVSRYECCRIVDGVPSSILDYNAIRHLSISLTCSDAQFHDVAKMVCKLKHLRTIWIQFYIEDPQKLDDFVRYACKSPRRIRALIIESHPCLENISDFVKLRFLDISAHRQPPSLSICKFYFLQVLIGNGDYSILAKAANKLTNLKHVYGVEDDALLSVAEVGKLTSLQELCFSVGTEPGHRIDELMNMNDLHQLKIKQLSNVRSLEEANRVNLVRKRNLTRLELHYRDGEYYWNEESSNPELDQQEVLAALRPPHTIRELFVAHYKGGSPAPWMDTSSLSWLEALELYGCTNLEELPPLWKLPCLKFLKLNRMEAIKSLGRHSADQMDIQFPVLEKLRFVDLRRWEEWNSADDFIWFPHLKSLEIYDCPKLKKIPDLPLSIEKLRMVNLGLEALPWSYKCSHGSRTFGGFQQMMSLVYLQIYNCPKIVQIGSSIGEEADNLLPSSLKELTLGGFLPRFLSAEVESQEFLKEKTREHAVLSSSSVFDRSASNKAANILPSSLESLSILYSDISQESLGRCLRGLISLRKLKINGCHKLLAATFSTLQNPATTAEQSGTKVTVTKGTLPSLEQVDIDNIFYLPILPIPKRLKTLYIRNSTGNPRVLRFPYEIEEWLLQCRESLILLELGNMPRLQTLPTSLESFSSLEFFGMFYAPELKSLPRMPVSLKLLSIYGCSAKLKKRCQENIGPDWPNINHIPHIFITAGKEETREAC